MIRVIKGEWIANENGHGVAKVVGSYRVTVNGLLDAMACMAREDNGGSVIYIELFGEIMRMMPHEWMDEKLARLELQRSPAYQTYILRKQEIAALVSVTGSARVAGKRSMAI